LSRIGALRRREPALLYQGTRLGECIGVSQRIYA
jgi:hypothetical protein